jgi:NAD(P) transhydrogenase subunit alpha
MRIGVPREITDGERRVALVPESVSRLAKAGAEVVVEQGAGVPANFPDELYVKAGASLGDPWGAGVVVKVQKPSVEEVRRLTRGAVLVSLLPVASSGDLLAQLSDAGVSVLGLEREPRITRAQSMDILSSQATISGYKAVLIGAAEMGKILPMLTTAAGNIPPAKAFILGAGVAGLMAIATARRMGAIVSGFDIRAAAEGGQGRAACSFMAAVGLATVGAHPQLPSYPKEPPLQTPIGTWGLFMCSLHVTG